MNVVKRNKSADLLRIKYRLDYSSVFIALLLLSSHIPFQDYQVPSFLPPCVRPLPSHPSLYSPCLIFLPVCSVHPPSRSSFPPIPPLPSLLFHSFSICPLFWPPLSLSFLSPPTPPPSYLSLPFIPFLLLSHSLLFRLFPFYPDVLCLYV